MLASEHPIPQAGIVFQFQSPARPHSNRNGDLFQLHSGKHGNARDFLFSSLHVHYSSFSTISMNYKERQCVDSIFHHFSKAT